MMATLFVSWFMVLSLKKHTLHAMDAAQLCAHPVLADEDCRSIIDGESGILAVAGAIGGAITVTFMVHREFTRQPESLQSRAECQYGRIAH